MSGMNGNAETEPRRSIDGTEKAFTFSGVELTVFLSGSEIWSPASANGRETGRHQRERQVLMQWGNAAKNRKVKEWNAALRNLKISSYLCPNPQKNEKRQKTEFQSLKPLELRGVELYFLCLSTEVTPWVVITEFSQHVFLGIEWVKDCWHISILVGEGLKCWLSTLRDVQQRQSWHMLWTFLGRLLKHQFQAKMPEKWSTYRVFTQARHTAAADLFAESSSAVCQSKVLWLTPWTPTSDLAGQGG